MQLRSLHILVIFDRSPKDVDTKFQISSGVTMHIEKVEDILNSVIMQFMPKLGSGMATRARILR